MRSQQDSSSPSVANGKKVRKTTKATIARRIGDSRADKGDNKETKEALPKHDQGDLLPLGPAPEGAGKTWKLIQTSCPTSSCADYFPNADPDSVDSEYDEDEDHVSKRHDCYQILEHFRGITITPDVWKMPESEVDALAWQAMRATKPVPVKPSSTTTRTLEVPPAHAPWTDRADFVLKAGRPCQIKWGNEGWLDVVISKVTDTECELYFAKTYGDFATMKLADVDNSNMRGSMLPDLGELIGWWKQC